MLGMSTSGGMAAPRDWRRPNSSAPDRLREVDVGDHQDLDRAFEKVSVVGVVFEGHEEVEMDVAIPDRDVVEGDALKQKRVIVVVFVADMKAFDRNVGRMNLDAETPSAQTAEEDSAARAAG